ncbi:MAG TPA: Repetin [Streptomyces sp.]|nr:Repetin [Streptomyces sp.]
MNRLTHRRTRIVALGAALLITAGAAGAAQASGSGGEGNRPREAAALTGSAKLYRSAGDDITFTFDAHLAAEDTADPTKARGAFSFSHYLGGRGASADVSVDCLVTGGKVAVVSGIITRSDGMLADAKGRRVGVTVHDLGKHARLGYSWAATEGPAKDLPRCVSSAPFEKVKAGTGDFKVLPWQPKL